MEFERRCWAQIDLDILKNNFKAVAKAANGTPVMAIIKADAYGHGAVRVAKLLANEGAACFGVSGLEEALELRRANIKQDILILGYTTPSSAKILAENNLLQTVYSLAYAQNLSKAAMENNVCVNVHIKIDTGMGRIGFSVRDNMQLATAEISAVCALDNLNIKGLYTHFAVADSHAQGDEEYTQWQHDLLIGTLDALSLNGIKIPLVHCCNSAGIFALPQFHHDMVRAGIVLYGENPSEDVIPQGILPAVQLKAAVSHVKHVPKGSYESYGRTFCAENDMSVATICVGYADGYPRLLSNMGTLEIHGKKAKVLGRVCMDQLMVDVTEIPNVKVGDIATVYGGGIADSVAEIAKMTNTINYEIICNISRRVPRVYMEKGMETDVVEYL